MSDKFQKIREEKKIRSLSINHVKLFIDFHSTSLSLSRFQLLKIFHSTRRWADHNDTTNQKRRRGEGGWWVAVPEGFDGSGGAAIGAAGADGRSHVV